MMYQNIPPVPTAFLELFPTTLESLIKIEEVLQSFLSVNEMRNYIKQRLERRYSCHASSTHPLLYKEYRMVIKILYDCKLAEATTYDSIYTYFFNALKFWRDQNSSLASSVSQTPYILSWGSLPYQPLGNELQEIQRLILLKIDFSNFQKLLNSLKKSYYSRSFFFRRTKFFKEDAQKAWANIHQQSFGGMPCTIVAPLSEQHRRSFAFLDSNYYP